jgi:cobalt/nickel transport protein
MQRGIGLAVLALAAVPAAAGAHFNMLLPSAAGVKRGEAVTLTYQWGHPFEHQLFDAPHPQSLTVVGPDGKQAELTRSLEKTVLAAGDKKVVAYQTRFTPEARGDYTFVLRTPPIWMEEDGEFLEDTVKVVLHVQAQKGWDEYKEVREGEWMPLTRPYGLPAGVAFQARLPDCPGALVEIERYNPTPPDKLPPDEQITRTAKTDPNGVVTATLTEPGWWCLAATFKRGTKEHDGKEHPLRQRSILWVYVDEPAVGR